MVSEMPTIRLKKRKLSKKLSFPVSHTFSIHSSPSFSILFVKDLPILQKKKNIWFLVLFLISSAANSVFFYLIYINWYCFYFMTSHPTLHVMQFRENRRHSPVLSEALGGGVGYFSSGRLILQISFDDFFSLKETPPLYKFCSPQKTHPAHWSISQVWILNLSLSHAQGVQNLRFLLDLMSTQNHL